MNQFSEDCLVLSIFVPAATTIGSDEELLPVMFWIHGGSFLTGSGGAALYDGRYLSNASNAVVVNVNYRLGALGFLAWDEDGIKFDGNQGIKDQQLGLKWVYDNIRSFGGDPNQITIFGESAGAQAVTFHLLSSVSDPYFQQAIVQSTFGYADYKTTEESKVFTTDLVNLLNCQDASTLQCLRSASPEEIVALASAVGELALERGDATSFSEPFRPVVDGVEFTDQPFEMFKRGRWSTGKNVIVGTTSEEYAGLHGYFNDIVFDEAYFVNYTVTFLGKEIGPAVAEEYLRRVENVSNVNYEDLMVEEFTDAYFICPSRLLGRLIGEYSRVYFYIYDHPETSAPWCSDPQYDQGCGYAYHSAELAYEFATGATMGYKLTQDDLTVTNILEDYWGSFAHNGKPTAAKFTSWPEFQENEEWPSIRIKSPNSLVDVEYRKEYCDFLDSLDYYVRASANSNQRVVSFAAISVSLMLYIYNFMNSFFK